MREGQTILLQHLNHSAEKIRTALDQSGLSATQRYQYYLQVDKIAAEFYSISDGASIDNAACEYLHALINEAEEGRKELINTGKVIASDGRSYATITIEQTSGNAFTVTASDKGAFFSETFTTNGTQFNRVGESLQSTISHDAHEVDFHLSNLDFTLDAEGYVRLNSCGEDSENVILEVSIPGTLTLGSGITALKSLTFSGYTLKASSALTTESLTLHCASADLGNLKAAEGVDTLTIEGRSDTHLAINGVHAPSPNITNAASLKTSGRILVDNSMTVNVSAWENMGNAKTGSLSASVSQFTQTKDATIEANTLNLTALALSNAGTLVGWESQSIKAERLSNDASGNIASKHLRIKGFSEATNAGTIGGQLSKGDGSSELSTDVTLEGTHLTNTGNLLGKIVTIDIATAEGRLINKNNIHADQTLWLKGDATLLNEGRMISTGTIEHHMANMLNTGTINANAGITGVSESGYPWTNGDNGTLSTGGKMSLIVSGGLVNEGTSGDISAECISFSMPTFTNRKTCTVWNKAELSIDAFIQDDTRGKFIVGDDSDEGVLTFVTNPGTYTNKGEVVIKGSVTGSDLKPLILDEGTQAWGEIEGTFKGDWEITDTTHLYGDGLKIHVTGDLIIHEGAALTCVGRVNGEDYASGGVTITVGGSLINKGTLTGGKNTHVNVLSILENHGKIESSGDLYLTCSDLFKATDADIKSTGILEITTDRISGNLSGLIASGKGYFILSSKGSVRFDNAEMSFGQGGRIESLEGNIDINPSTRIHSQFFGYNVEMKAHNGTVKNLAGWVLVFGDLIVEARDIVNTRGPLKGMIETGDAEDTNGYFIKLRESSTKQAEFYVQGSLFFTAKDTILNHGSLITTVGDLHFTGAHVINEDQLVDGIVNYWGKIRGRKRRIRSGYHYYDGWKEREGQKAHVGACIVGANAHVHIRGHDGIEKDYSLSDYGHDFNMQQLCFKNTGHFHAKKDLDITTEEGREAVVTVYNGLDPKSKNGLIPVAHLPQTGLSINVYDPDFFSKYPVVRATGEAAKKYVYMVNLDYDPGAWAEAMGVDLEEITAYSKDAAYILPPDVDPAILPTLRHLVDPLGSLLIRQAMYGEYMPIFEQVLREDGYVFPVDEDGDEIPLNVASLTKISRDNSKRFVERLMLAQSGEDMPKLLGDGSIETSVEEGALVASLGTSSLVDPEYQSLLAEYDGDHSRVFVALWDRYAPEFGNLPVIVKTVVRMPDGELVICEVDNWFSIIQNNIEQYGQGTMIAEGDVYINVDTLKNLGHMKVTGKIQAVVDEFTNEAPVYEYEETVYESKGMLRGTRARTFTIREVQDGGVVTAADVTIISRGNITIIGGRITADNDIHLRSEGGTISVKPQEGSHLVSWNAGRLGRALGRAEHALATDFHPGEIHAGGTVSLMADDMDILIEASRVIGEKGVWLVAEGDITVRGKTAKHLSEDSFKNRGTKFSSKKTETLIHEDALVASPQGQVSMHSDGNIEVEGSLLYGKEGVFMRARDVNLLGLDETFKTTDGAAAFEGLSFKATQTQREYTVVFPTRILSGKNIVIHADNDVLIEAAKLRAQNDIIIKGNDVTIRGKKQIMTEKTKGIGVGVGFFGSKAFEDLIGDADKQQVIEDFMRENPFAGALLNLQGIEDGEDAIAGLVQLAMQAHAFKHILGDPESFSNVDLTDPAILENIGKQAKLLNQEGKFDPRITIRLSWNESARKLVTLMSSEIEGENVYIIADNDLNLQDGTSIYAAEIAALRAGHDIIMTPGVEEDIRSGREGGVSFSTGGAYDNSVGVDGYEYESRATTHKHNLIKGRKVVLHAGNGIYMKGTFVDAEEAEVEAKIFEIEAVLDRYSSQMKSGSFNTAGNVSGSYSEEGIAWVNNFTGIIATKKLSVKVSDLIYIGGSLHGPEGRTFIEADRITVKHLDEHEHSVKAAMSMSFAWDKNKKELQGDLPLIFEYELEKSLLEGIKQTVVSGTNADGGNPHLIHDPENSDDPTQIESDPSQEHVITHSSHRHVHVYAPVPRFVLKGIGNLWSSVTEDVSPSDNEDLRKIAAIHEVLKNAEGDTEVDTSDAAPENILGYEVVEDNSSLPEEDRSELSAVRIENESTGSEVKMTFIGLNADQQFIESFFSNEDMALGAMERVNEDGSTQGTIVAQNEAGDEIVLNVNAAAIDEIAGGKTLAEVSPEELKTYISDLLEYQKGVRRGLWIDGPIKATKETWALAKGVARKTWEGLRDPVKADMELYRWMLEGYAKACSEWALAMENPKDYLAKAGNRVSIAWNQYIAELQNNGEFAGESGFSLAMAFVPIPVKGIPLMKNAVNIVDDITDLARFGDEVSTVKEFESLVSDLSRMGKGELGESAARRTMERVGYQELPSKLPGGQGFDGIFVKYGSDGGIDHLIITESKFSKSGKGRLGNPGKGKQMGDRWIDKTIEQMRGCSVPEIKDVGRFLERNQHLIERKINVLDGAGVNRWNTLKPPPTEKFN